MTSMPLLSGRLSPRALSLCVALFIVLVGASLVAATAWQVRQSANERLAGAHAAVFNIARAVEQHAIDTVHQADNTLKNIAERIEVDGIGAPQRQRLYTLMARNVADVEGLQGLFIYDEFGNWVANSFTSQASSKNNSDRDYFIFHQQNRLVQVNVGSVVQSRTTGELIIPISRRLNYPDGRFAGVVLATVPVAYFQSFFDRLNVGEQGVIFMANSNGELLARRPAVASLMTTNISKGEIFSKYLPEADYGIAMLTSVVDRIERIYAYRRVEGLPLVIAAGLSSGSVYAPWWGYVIRSLLITGLMVGALVLMGVLIWRQIQQLLRAQSKLSAAHHELELIASTDGLTNIANRRHFDSALASEWVQSRSSQAPLGIILLDIDWFKQYNDRYGHLQGDECLKRVASLIRDNLLHEDVSRPGYLAARYGGEEFVILLPDTDLAAGAWVAERIRAAIASDALEHAGSLFGTVTISAGVVSTESVDANTPAELLAKADSYLYGAKKQGRNRVCYQWHADYAPA